MVEQINTNKNLFRPDQEDALNCLAAYVEAHLSHEYKAGGSRFVGRTEYSELPLIVAKIRETNPSRKQVVETILVRLIMFNFQKDSNNYKSVKESVEYNVDWVSGNTKTDR